MTSRSVLRLTMLAVLVGCGGGRGGFDTGVDDAKPFDEFTVEEARRSCDNLQAYLRSNVPTSRDLELTCIVNALGSTATPADCRESVTACLAGDPEPFLGMGLDCSMAGPVTGCSAPAGEVEQCINADLDQIFARLDMVSCDIAGDAVALAALQEEPPVPAQCSELGSTCPELADGFTN